MAGEATVGSIIAFMRLDRTQWTRDKDATKREAAELDGKRVKITITTNAREAVAAMAGVDAANSKNARSTAALAAARRSAANATASVASAQRSLITSSDSLAQAQQRIAAAQQRIRASGVGTAEDYKKLTAAQRARDAAMRTEASASDRVAAALRNEQSAIDRVTLAQKRLDDETGKGGDSARRKIGLLSTAVIGLGPAAIPVGAVVAGAFAGVVPTAGAALLAVHGVSTAMKQGGPIGRQYTAGIGLLKGEFTKLSSIAAAGVLGGFHSGLRALQPLFPTLNHDVAMFSAGLGKIVGNAAPGLVSMFHQFNPLFVTFDQQLITGSQRFKAWATSSDSIQHFVAYAQTQLPLVQNTIANLATTIGHVVQAAAPFGSTMLASINLLSRALNSLPVGVLQTVVPLLAGLKLGSAASAGIGNAATGLGTWAAKAKEAGGAASGAAGVVGSLGKAVGFLGPVGLAAGLALGGLSIIMGHHQQAAVASTQRVNALTQALQNQQTTLGLLAELQSTGATSAADKLGISQNTLLGALQSKASAIAAYNGQVTAMYGRYQAAGVELAKFGNIQDRVNNEAGYNQAKANYDKLGGALVGLSAAMQKSEAEYAKAKKALADYAASQGDAILAAQVQSGAVDKVARAYGTTVDAYYAGKLAADKKTQSDQAQTVAMQLEGDAAGLLSQAFDKLNGRTLDISDANIQVHSSAQAVIASLKQNGHTLDLNTQAGIANQQALNGMIRSAEAHAVAISHGNELTKAGTAAYRADLTALRDHLVAIGGNAAAVRVLNQAIASTPKVVETTPDFNKAAADAKIAAYKRAIGQLPKGISTTVRVLGADQAKQVIRSVVDYANSQHPVIHVATINTSTGSVSSGRQVANADGGGVPEGWSTVGERGWEAVHKKGNTVQVFSHEKSRQLLPQGPSVPAFASGTAGSKAKPKPVYVPITVTADGGRAYGIDSYIKGQIPSAAQATRLLSIAVNDAFKLNGVMGKLAAVKADLANTQQAALQFRDTIITGRLGTVDPNAYGSASDLTAAYTSGSADNARYKAEFAKLKKEGLADSLLAQFTGPSAGLDALASAGGLEISQLKKSYAGFVGSTGAAGSAAANSLYGGRITQDQRAVNQLSAEVVKDRAALLAVGRALVQYTHRPLTVAIGNKEFLKTIEASGALQSLVDDLKRRLKL